MLSNKASVFGCAQGSCKLQFFLCVTAPEGSHTKSDIFSYLPVTTYLLGQLLGIHGFSLGRQSLFYCRFCNRFYYHHIL